MRSCHGLLIDSTTMNENSGTRTSRVLESLPDRSRAVLGSLLENPQSDRKNLLAQVRDYVASLEQQKASAELLDLKTARLLGRKSVAMLERTSADDEEAEKLIEAAVIYFVEYDDADHDFHSESGFDDDLEVVDTVARELGFTDVVAMTPDGD